MKIKQILYLMSFCLLLSATTFAQQVQEFTVSGTVVDKDKLSMPGVSVYIKDKPSKGTTTDNDGNFKLKVVYGDKMIFSFIGFKPSEHVAIKPQTDLTVTLLEDNNSLDEVVVVALGNVQRKISSVGAITTVSTKDIQSPSPSISNLLGGRAAGVISLQSSGEPGQNIADFWVRGIGTFGANSSALVLIDGLEGDLNTIDPADVESFSILKDASATAVYGVRGANGVVYPNVNWQDEILNKTFWRHTYYVSGRGGSDVARYFLSLGGKNESAAYKVDKNSIYSSNVSYNTYNYRINLDVNLTKSTKVYLGSDGFLSQLNQPGVANTEYIWGAQSRLTPLSIPTQYSNGMLPGRGAGELSSPYVMINHTGKAANEVYKGKSTLAINQDFSELINGLKLRVQGAYDIHSYFNERRSVQPALYNALGRASDGSLIMQETVQEKKASYSKSTRQYRKYHFEATLNYDRLFGTDHRTSALVYYYISDSKDTDDATSNLSAIPLRYQGVSSRFTYGYKDTYLLDVNFGYTGSENFQPGRQYGFFPSVALGWVPTGYKFIQEALPWLDYLKIRASYGSVGNDRITDVRFPYLTKVNEGTGSAWGVPDIEIIGETRIGADNLAWEKAIKSNVGIEGKLFNNKIDFVVDIFHDQRNGIFQQRVQVPEFVGVVSNPYANVGKMKSYGADGNISFTQDFTPDFGFTLRGNFTYSKNKVQNWEQAYLEYPYLEYNNFPYNSIRGYQAVGLFKDEDDIKYSPKQTFGEVMPGDIKYKDINGDGMVDKLDMVPLTHSTYPLLMYGLGAEIRYKNLTLGVLFKGTGKTSFFYVGQKTTVNDETRLNGMGYMPFFEGNTGNVLTLAANPANRWIPRDYAIAHGIDPSLAENKDARFPRLQYGNNSNNSQLSTFWQGDSRYIRLQEITLSYHLAAAFLRRIGVSSLDIQFVGNNLYVWDKVKLFDPEQARWNGRVYPIPSTYSLQLYVNL